MANDINSVILVGRLTRDCELKTTAGGTAVCRFSVAVNRKKKNGDRWEDEVNYFDVVLWGKSAETLRPYLDKGRQVAIEGELRQNRWEQDGQTKSKIEINANNVQLLSSPGQGGSSSRSSQGDYSSAPVQETVQAAPARSMGPEDFNDSDIPF